MAKAKAPALGEFTEEKIVDEQEKNIHLANQTSNTSNAGIPLTFKDHEIPETKRMEASH